MLHLGFEASFPSQAIERGVGRGQVQEEGKDEEKRGRAAEETEASRRTYPHRLGLTGKAETLIMAQAKVQSTKDS